jgi:NAD(P)-dependent dehydrogenase (short-subunit alcohol dehydrogenase family)
MAYCVTKAAQLHFMRCAAQTQGSKLRINAVLPGLLLTDWGMLYSEEQIKALKEKATLKKETEIDQCADAFVWIAKNTSMTGQKISVGMLSCDSRVCMCEEALLTGVDAGLNVAYL